MIEPDTLIENAEIAKYTTWRVGGRAERLFRPSCLSSLSSFLTTVPSNEPLTWLGLGSNVLVRDSGIAGTVILTHSGLGTISQVDELTLYAQAGAPCPTVAKKAAKLGLAGAEFLVGIPGTMGGALAMNAGAYGGETWNIVSKVEVISVQGDVVTKMPEQFAVGYRTVKGAENEYFVGCYLSLSQGDPEELQQRLKELLKQRGSSQPIGLPSGGSVFRNPPNQFAAKLIEQCGLKGKKIGGAVVSEKHANFIINDGTASAADIEQLIAEVKRTVESQCGVELIPEVKILGKSNAE